MSKRYQTLLRHLACCSFCDEKDAEGGQRERLRNHTKLDKRSTKSFVLVPPLRKKVLVIFAKWYSFLRHVASKHDHLSNLFKKCAHEELEEPRHWIKNGK